MLTFAQLVNIFYLRLEYGVVLNMKGLLACILLVVTMNNAHAGLILFDDRDAFELAVAEQLSFEGFNVKGVTNPDFDFVSGKKGFSSTSSQISEGDYSIKVMEKNTLTLNFNYDVFAFGFDVNELNATNLNYVDSAGNEILDALKVTDIWYESTFFGVLSDTAITSFSLVGSGSSSASYGFDALSYTANPVTVSEPNTIHLIFLAILLMLITNQLRKKLN